MSLELKYTVTSVKVKNEVNSEGVTLENAVCQTHWLVTGTDADGNTGEFTGATPFTAASVPAASFTSFETLVEENVVKWITAVVDGDAGYKEHIVAQIQKQIDVNLITEPTLPWATDDSITPTPDPAV